MYLVFDTETTGLPHNKTAPVSDLENWPRLVQIAWQLHDSKGNLVSNDSIIVKPDGFTIPYNAQKVHGISTKRAEQEGDDVTSVLERFLIDLDKCSVVVGHNIEFDLKIIGSELFRLEIESDLLEKESIDTQKVSIEFCALAGGL